MEKTEFESGLSEQDKALLESIVGKEIVSSRLGKDKDLSAEEMDLNTWDYSNGTGIKIVNGFAMDDSIIAIEMMIAIKAETYTYIKLASTIGDTPYEGLYYPVITVSRIGEDEYYDTNGFLLQSMHSVIKTITVYQDSRECPAASARYDSQLVMELQEGVKYCFMATAITDRRGGIVLSIIPSPDLWKFGSAELDNISCSDNEVSWSSDC
jgi:hypothetical protein